MTESPLGRLPSLAREIGLVAASSLRLASRYVNVLRAGKPAALDDLAACGLLVVQAPPRAAAEWTYRLLRHRLAARNRPCVFLGGDPGSAALAALHHQRVPVAVALPAPTHAGPALVTEGDPPALAAVRAWTRCAGIALVELRVGRRPAFDAALHLLSVALPAILSAAGHGLRTAGVGPVEARHLLHHLAGDALRAQGLQRPGTKTRRITGAPRAGIDREIGALGAIDHSLASFYHNAMDASLRFSRSAPAGPKWAAAAAGELPKSA